MSNNRFRAGSFGYNFGDPLALWTVTFDMTQHATAGFIDRLPLDNEDLSRSAGVAGAFASPGFTHSAAIDPIADTVHPGAQLAAPSGTHATVNFAPAPKPAPAILHFQDIAHRLDGMPSAISSAHTLPGSAGATHQQAAPFVGTQANFHAALLANSGGGGGGGGGGAGGDSGGDPTGQLWAAFGGPGDGGGGNPDGQTDFRIEHADSDGLADTYVIQQHANHSAGGYSAIALDTSANLSISMDNTFHLHVTNLTTGVDLTTTVIASTADGDVVNAFVVDAQNNIIWADLFGYDYLDANPAPYSGVHGGVLMKITYNQTTGAISSPYTFNDAGPTWSLDMTKVLIDSGSTGNVYADGRSFFLSHDGSTLYYVDDNDNDPGGFWGFSTNGIFKVSTSGSVGTGNAPTPVLLSSQAQFPVNDSNGYITALEVDEAKGIIYFTTNGTAENVNTSQDGIWWMPIAGGTATKMTIPGGVSVKYPVFFGDGLALDINTQQLYYSDKQTGEIVRFTLSADGHSFTSASNFAAFDASGGTDNDGGFANDIVYDNLPTLANVTGTSTEAVQGGSAITLLTGSPTMSDPDGFDLRGATVTITNAQAGDILAASVAGTSISASYSSITHVLTLSGEDSFAHYVQVFNSVTYQDTGTDNSTGSHPTRTLTWIISDGVTIVHPSTSDPNEKQTTLTIDRAPTLVTDNYAVLEGSNSSGTAGTGGTGVFGNDSDKDGDTFTITAVNGSGANVGNSIAGTYGHLTLNANGSDSYLADNIAAIDAAPNGSHPVDSFTYTASDGLGGVSTQTVTFTVDRAPTVVSDSANVSEGGSATATAGTGVLNNDSDKDGDSLTVSAVAGSGANVGVSIAGAYGHLTLNATGSYTYNADKTAAIDSAPSGSHPIDTFTYTDSDGHGGTTSTTLSFTVFRAPDLGGAGNTAGYTEQLAAATVDSGLTSADPDDLTLTSATVTISAGLFTGDELKINGTTSGSIGAISYSFAGGVMTLTGSDTAADYQAALRLVKFDSTSDNPDNFGTDTSRTITWQVDNGQSLNHASATTNSTIDVTAVNDPPTLPTDTNAVANSVTEGAAEDTVVGITAHSTDPDSVSVTYSLTDDAGGRFKIDATTGVVTVSALGATHIDYETATSYDITVQATDGTDPSTTKTFTINVTDVAPSQATDSDAGANTVAEGAAEDTLVGITASSSDVNGGTVTYSLSDDAGGRFKIDASTGVVTVSAAGASSIDYESATSYDITVKTADASGAFTTKVFTIAVSDVAPSTPGDGNGAADSVAEGAANGTAVGITASSTDPNGGTVTFTLTDNAGGRFAIDSSTGVVTVADGSLLDYETNTSHNITVKATDASGAFTTQTFSIAVSDVAPSTPTDSDAGVNTVAEGAANGTAVGITASSTDVNGGTVTFTLTNDAGGRFTIDGTTGVVTVADASLINYESATSHNITVKAADASGAFTTQTFVIAVSDVAPSVPTDGNAAANSVAEGAANGTAVGITASSSDVNGGTVTFTLSDDAGGRFTIDGTTGVVTVADGTLLDYETTTSHNITVKAADASGAFTSQTFAIAVTDVGFTAPTDSNGAANSVAEGASNGSTVGITVVAGDPGGTISYSLTNDAGGRFQIDTNTGVVTVADGTLLNYESATSHNITVQATDGTNTASQSFAIAVSDVAPSTPTDSDAGTNTVAENSANGTVVGVTASSADVNGGTVTYSLTNSAGGRFAINSSTGVVTVADGTLLDFESATSHNITVKAADASGAFTTQVFTIAVTNVDDAPTAKNDAFSTSETTAIGAGLNVFNNNGSGADADVDGPPLSISAVNGSGANVGALIALASGAALQLNANGTFTYNPNHAFDSLPAAGSGAANLTATDSFTYTLTGGGTATVTVTVNGVDSDDTLLGTAGNNTMTGGIGADTFILDQGGNDTVNGNSGSDTFFLGGTLTAADSVTGGAENDLIVLDGNYATQLVFAATTFQDIERFRLQAGHDYNLKLNDGNIGAGDRLTVRAFDLGAGDHVTINDSAETDGSLRVFGGDGGNTLTGGGGHDHLVGGAAADTLKGGGEGDLLDGLGGNDTFVYSAAADSTGADYDSVVGFDTGADHFDLSVNVTGIDTKVTTGQLGTAHFDTNLANAIDATHLAKHHAVLFTPDAGNLAGSTFLIIDANGVAGYQAGQDLVIQLDGAVALAGLHVGNFI